MKCTYLKKGDKYRFKNFPNLGLFLMAEGRLEVRWFNLEDFEDSHDSCVKETLFIHDYFDRERLARLYPGQGIVDHEGICLS